MAGKSQRLTAAEKKRLLKKGKKRGPRGTTLLTSPLKDSIISGEAAPDLYEPKDLNFLLDAIDPDDQATATARPLRQVADTSGAIFGDEQSQQAVPLSSRFEETADAESDFGPLRERKEESKKKILRELAQYLKNMDNARKSGNSQKLQSISKDFQEWASGLSKNQRMLSRKILVEARSKITTNTLQNASNLLGAVEPKGTQQSGMGAGNSSDLGKQPPKAEEEQNVKDAAKREQEQMNSPRRNYHRSDGSVVVPLNPNDPLLQYEESTLKEIFEDMEPYLKDIEDARRSDDKEKLLDSKDKFQTWSFTLGSNQQKMINSTLAWAKMTGRISPESFQGANEYLSVIKEILDAKKRNDEHYRQERKKEILIDVNRNKEKINIYVEKLKYMFENNYG